MARLFKTLWSLYCKRNCVALQCPKKWCNLCWVETCIANFKTDNCITSITVLQCSEKWCNLCCVETCIANGKTDHCIASVTVLQCPEKWYAHCCIETCKTHRPAPSRKQQLSQLIIISKTKELFAPLWCHHNMMAIMLHTPMEILINECLSYVSHR